MCYYLVLPNTDKNKYYSYIIRPKKLVSAITHLLYILLINYLNINFVLRS